MLRLSTELVASARLVLTERFVFALVRRCALIFCGASSALLFNEAAIAGVEKWIDANGQVSYSDHPPPGVVATPVEVRHNVIEIDKTARVTITGNQSVQPPPDCEPMLTASTASRADIQLYIELCRENRGVDCEAEARQMIDGPAPVIFRRHPIVFPRLDLKPAPPGLRLKFSIRP